MRSGKKSATPLKIYEIEFSNAFPYEQAVAVHVANPGDPIALSAQMDKDRMHRIYRNHPFQHVSWALMEGFQRYDYSPESLAGKNEDLWVQIDYAVFATHHGPDDRRIKGLRQKLKSGGLDAVAFPSKIRPESLCIGTCDDDAFHSHRVEGELRRKPYHLLYVTEPSKLPVINNHTIPEDVDFGWNSVTIGTYRRFDSIPTYRELLDRMAEYAACFEGLIKSR